MLIGVATACVLSTRRAKLRIVIIPEHERSSDQTAGQPTEPANNDPANNEAVVLPWWHSQLNRIAVLIAVIVLAAGAGFVIGERHATQHPNSVDIGYLQDMRAHHEQAVEMSLIFLGKQGTNPTLHLIAKEIAFGQAVDIGRMIQLLRGFGKAEANESGTGMTWMNDPVPLDRMPGLATDNDLNALIAARGTGADRVFATLMIAHHEGGIHMADFAAAHAATSQVRAMASSSSQSQRGEIAELKKLMAI